MTKRVGAAGPVQGRWALPEGWSWHRARDIAKIVGGSTPKNAAETTNYSEDGTPWLTPADLSGYSKPTIGQGRRNLAPHVVNRSSLLPTGAVLISSRAPVGYCAVASNPMVTNQGFRSLILANHVDPYFVRYYVLFSRKYLEDHASGTTFKELSGSALGDLVFPIPSLDVQRGVVARIDELFAEIDDGAAALVRARVDLVTWRKTLLKAAITGKLTANWRSLKGVVSSSEDNLPTTWRIDNVGSIATSLDNMRRPISRNIRQGRPGTVPYYGANGPVGFIDDYIFDEPLVLVVEDETFTGRIKDFSYIVRGKSWINNHAHVLRASDKVSPEYLNFCLAQYPFAPLTKGTTGRKKLTKAALMGALIPVPPADEQAEICTILAEIEGKGDYLREMITAIEPASASLRQSILAAAFHGDLV